MRYSVKCNKCGKEFAAETEVFGQQKYRCPYCREVMTCAFNPEKPFWTKARSVRPVEGVLPVGTDGKPLQVVPVKVVTAIDTLQDAGERMVSVGKKSGKRIHGTVDWVLDHLTIFFGGSFARIKRFREDYEDADMWLFFGFSVLFVLMVIAGLFICAQITKVLVFSHSWLLHELPFLRTIL